MSSILIAGLLAAALTVGLPAALLPQNTDLPADSVIEEVAQQPESTAETPIETAAESEAEPPTETPAETPAETEPAAATYDKSVQVRLLDQEAVTELPLHDYLIGVVLQEMPASFEEEALKAQAVAARTFTVRLMQGSGAHEDADICGDSTCCQCYLSAAEGIEAYGSGYEAAYEKVRKAVEATDGEIITYQGAAIEAAYFSSTGGSTEAAAAVWGGEVPYLQPVSSPEELSESQQVFSLEEFREILAQSDLTGNPTSWFGETTYTSGGAVDQMTIGGVTYDGVTLRARFSLRSARFRVAVTADGIVFEVTGSGHGVGMSQYGANTMAAGGHGYTEILLHYYTGTEIQRLTA